jgi:CRP-like cAMP-binding protein
VNFRATATYSASALTPLKLAAVDPRRVIEISQKFPIIAAGLSWCTAREFAILGDQAIRLGRLSARQRLAHLFLELWHRFALIQDEKGNWLEIPMT